MTATELISRLQNILAKRDGEDLEVRLDVDFDCSYSIFNITLHDGSDEDEDEVILQSPECVEAILKYDPNGVPRERGSQLIMNEHSTIPDRILYPGPRWSILQRRTDFCFQCQRTESRDFSCVVAAFS
jgi:hypothetical protein